MFLNLDLLKTKTFKSRYDQQKFIPYSEDVYDILEAQFLEKLRKLPTIGTYVVYGEENRPELIAYRLWGDVNLWMILMAYNDLLDFRTIQSGVAIRYPSLESLEDLYFSLTSLERSNQISLDTL